MGRRLLIIEDEGDTRQMIHRLLECYGYTVESVRDGAEALAAINCSPFHGILLDMVLPDIDGLAILGRLRAANCSIPVVVLSAYQHLALAAVSQGAHAYLMKPFETAQFRDVTERWFGSPHATCP
jgi:CheY-like chemotaxis protein